jgi:putative thioredoxin
VKLFVDGEVADEFTGVLPEYAIRQWLEKAIPSEDKRKVEEAERLIDGGETDRARSLLEDVLSAEPENPKARILLARILVFDDPARAVELASTASFAGMSYQQTADAIREIGEVAWSKRTGRLASPRRARTRPLRRRRGTRRVRAISKPRSSR